MQPDLVFQAAHMPKEEVGQLHMLPFHVVPRHGAPSQSANVDQYFCIEPDVQRTPGEEVMPGSTLEAQEAAVQQATFRGRVLRGVEMYAPEGYAVHVVRTGAREEELSEEEDDADDEEGKKHETVTRTAVVEQEARGFTFWEHQRAPVGTENVYEWMSFAQVARDIHG